MNNAQLHGCEYEGWQCFHCGETFTTFGGAKIHFGTTPDSKPGCLKRVEVGDQRGWLMDIRKLEDSLREYKERSNWLEGECDRVTESKDQLRQQLEQAEAQIAKAKNILFAGLQHCIPVDRKELFINDAHKALNGSSEAWLLRKQAEAVDEVNRRLTTLSEETRGSVNAKVVTQYCASIAGEESDRLRKQADAIDAGNAGGGV